MRISSSTIQQPNRADILTCSYQADDGFDTTTATASTTVGNASPEISNHFIFPSTPAIGETISCEAIISEPDAQSYTTTYTWTNTTTGATIGSANIITMTASMGSLNDNIECSITATDASGATESVSAISETGQNPSRQAQEQRDCTIVIKALVIRSTLGRKYGKSFMSAMF